MKLETRCGKIEKRNTPREEQKKERICENQRKSAKRRQGEEKDERKE